MYDNLALYYDEENNVFIDGEGEVIFEIFEIITPNDLYLFKHNKIDAVVSHSTLPGMLVELYWPDDYFIYCKYSIVRENNTVSNEIINLERWNFI